jgi:phosphoribosylaminoimidazole (AIR) synthetase
MLPTIGATFPKRTKLYSPVMVPTIKATPIKNKAVITGHGVNG